jgi:hypothetical protein
MAKKEELDLYGEIVYNHKLSIRSIIREFFLNAFAKRYRAKESIYHENARFPSLDKDNQIKYLAVIQDGKVVEMLRLKNAVADIIVKPKTKFVEFDPSTTIVKKGMELRGKGFINTEERANDET